MFDRIVDILLQIWDQIWPLVIILPYQTGVQVRLGKVKRVLPPGWYLKIPVIDHVMEDIISSMVHHISGQAVTTKDGREIGYDAIITSHIDDMEKAAIKVNDVKDAIVNACTGVIATQLADENYDDIIHGRVSAELLRLCRVRGRRWGIDVEEVQLAGICKVRNIRLSGERAVEHHA